MKTVIECAFCDGTAQLNKQVKDLIYRKENFKVVQHFYKCEQCGEEFTTNEVDEVTLSQAHNQYREKHSIPFPEEIIALKEKYGLSAAKMGEVLGLGQNSYGKYESGEIPTAAIGNLLKAAANPSVFLSLLEDAKDTFKPKVFEELKNKVQESLPKWDIDNNYSYLDLYKTPNSYNGFKAADVEKLSNVLVAIISNCNPVYNDRLKLNKLLFYTDFGHYKMHGFSITGTSYRAIQFGPVPSKYDAIFSYLQSDGIICSEWLKDEVKAGKEVFKTNQNIEEVLFTDQELETIRNVINKYKNTPTWDIVDISHEERAWLDHNNDRNLISYQEYAFDLKGV